MVIREADKSDISVLLNILRKPFAGVAKRFNLTGKSCPKNLVLFLISVLIIIFRQYSLFTEPRFWAEEGTVYFSFAFSHNWLTVLLKPHYGYYSLFSNFASLLASRTVPLEWAPLVTTLLAFFVQCIPLAIIIFGKSGLWSTCFRKIIAISIILFAPLSGESWLNTINSQFHFSLIIVLILCEELDTDYIRKYFYRIVIVIAGLTGAASCFLAPLYLIRAYLTKKREAIIQAGLITICALIHITITTTVLPTQPASLNRFYLPSAPTLGFIIWIKNFILPFFGLPLASAIGSIILAACYKQYEWPHAAGYNCLVFQVLFLLLLCSKLDKNEIISVMGSYLLLVLLTTYAAYGNKTDYISPEHSQRYYYVPNVLMLMMVFLSIKWSKEGASKIFALFLIGLLTMGILNGAVIYRTSIESRESCSVWREEVAKWRTDHSYPLQICPSGWRIELKEQPSP